MELIKEECIHDELILDESEKDVLISACKIIETIRSVNAHSSEDEDSYLNEKCDTILSGIFGLLDYYSNEYPKYQE